MHERGNRVGEGRLGDHRRDVGIGRRDGQDVAAAERRPPQDDSIRVDSIELASPRDDRTVVIVLAADVEQLARLAGRRTEMPAVEYNDGKPGVAERLGVGGQPVVRVAENPWAITTQGRSPCADSGR
jgi:hypothetical protein